MTAETNQWDLSGQSSSMPLEITSLPCKNLVSPVMLFVVNTMFKLENSLQATLYDKMEKKNDLHLWEKSFVEFGCKFFTLWK